MTYVHGCGRTAAHAYERAIRKFLHVGDPSLWIFFLPCSSCINYRTSSYTFCHFCCIFVDLGQRSTLFTTVTQTVCPRFATSALNEYALCSPRTEAVTHNGCYVNCTKEGQSPTLALYFNYCEQVADLQLNSD